VRCITVYNYPAASPGLWTTGGVWTADRCGEGLLSPIQVEYDGERKLWTVPTCQHAATLESVYGSGRFHEILTLFIDVSSLDLCQSQERPLAKWDGYVYLLAIPYVLRMDESMISNFYCEFTKNLFLYDVCTKYRYLSSVGALL